MNPVDEFLKVAVSREKIEGAIGEVSRRMKEMRGERFASGEKPTPEYKKKYMGLQKRKAKLEKALTIRERGSQSIPLHRGKEILRPVVRGHGKKWKKMRMPYTFEPTRGGMKQVHRKLRYEVRSSPTRYMKLEARPGGPEYYGKDPREARMEGRKALRKRKAIKTTKKPPAAPKSSAPSKPATSTAKTVTKAVKKGKGLGRAAKALGAAGLLAAAGYGTYRMLKGRKKKELKKAAMVSFFEEIEEIEKTAIGRTRMTQAAYESLLAAKRAKRAMEPIFKRRAQEAKSRMAEVREGLSQFQGRRR